MENRTNKQRVYSRLRIASALALRQFHDVEFFVLVLELNVSQSVPLDLAVVVAIGTLETRPETTLIFQMAR